MCICFNDEQSLIAYAHKCRGKWRCELEIVKGWKINELAGCHFFLAIAPYCYPVRQYCLSCFSAKKIQSSWPRHWALLFGITGAIVCASKLAFMGWGIGIRDWTSPAFSGHTALSSAFWPILLWLLCACWHQLFVLLSWVFGRTGFGYCPTDGLIQRLKWLPVYCTGTAGSVNSVCCYSHRSRHSIQHSYHGQVWQAWSSSRLSVAEYRRQEGEKRNLCWVRLRWSLARWKTRADLGAFTDSDKRGKDEGFRK